MEYSSHVSNQIRYGEAAINAKSGARTYMDANLGVSRRYVEYWEYFSLVIPSERSTDGENRNTKFNPPINVNW